MVTHTLHSEFESRLGQLTEMEAVREAYLAFLATAFPSHRVRRTPQALSPRGIQRGESLPELVAANIAKLSEECLYDELACVIGPRGSIVDSLQEVMEGVRTLTQRRLEQLLLEPRTEQSQTAFHQQMRTLVQESVPFTGMLLEVGEVSGLASVARAELPTGGEVYEFTSSILAVLVPNCLEPRACWTAQRCRTSLSAVLRETGTPFDVAACVGCWPADFPTGPLLLQALQLGLSDAVSLNADTRSPRVVFARNSTAGGDSDRPPEEDGGAATFSRTVGPVPDLRAGSARKIDDPR